MPKAKLQSADVESPDLGLSEDEAQLSRVDDVYREWRAVEGLSAIVTREEVARNDYNLSPSRYVSTNGVEEVLPLEEAVVLLREAEEERREADEALKQVLRELGLQL